MGIKKVMQKVTKAYGNNLPGDHLFCIINSSSSGKLQYSVTASKASGVSASDILAAMNEAVGGRGGGRQPTQPVQSPSPKTATSTLSSRPSRPPPKVSSS